MCAPGWSLPEDAPVSLAAIALLGHAFFVGCISSCHCRCHRRCSYCRCVMGLPSNVQPQKRSSMATKQQHAVTSCSVLMHLSRLHKSCRHACSPANRSPQTVIMPQQNQHRHRVVQAVVAGAAAGSSRPSRPGSIRIFGMSMLLRCPAATSSSGSSCRNSGISNCRACQGAL